MESRWCAKYRPPNYVVKYCHGACSKRQALPNISRWCIPFNGPPEVFWFMLTQPLTSQIISNRDHQQKCNISRLVLVAPRGKSGSLASNWVILGLVLPCTTIYIYIDTYMYIYIINYTYTSSKSQKWTLPVNKGTTGLKCTWIPSNMRLLIGNTLDYPFPRHLRYGIFIYIYLP